MLGVASRYHGTGGSGWAVPTGRRDGLVSLASDAESIYGPKDSIDDQIKKFANKGLSIEDLVTLVGGHTIGTAGCVTFSDRLYNYNNTNAPDPAIDQGFLPIFKPYVLLAVILQGDWPWIQTAKTVSTTHSMKT
ncbi:putative peroxidase [Helianthus annuus]|nr:putative peroxidase [Helianthus annuus]